MLPLTGLPVKSTETQINTNVGIEWGIDRLTSPVTRSDVFPVSATVTVSVQHSIF